MGRRDTGVKGFRQRREREDLGHREVWTLGFSFKMVWQAYVLSVMDMRKLIIIDGYLTCCLWDALNLNYK